MLKFVIIIFCSLYSLSGFAEIISSNAIAMHGKPKYGNDFKYVDYINPDALKGGKVIFSSIGTYDTFNPFTLKGTSAAGIGLLYETLTVGSSDEAFTEYGLLAKNIEWPDDRSWVAYELRDEAKWHDGKKITSDDVVWTFNNLMKKGHPLTFFQK